MWRSEDIFQGSVLSFCHVGPRNPSQVPRIGVRQFYSVSHLTTQEDVLIGSNKLLNTSLVIQHDHSW